MPQLVADLNRELPKPLLHQLAVGWALRVSPQEFVPCWEEIECRGAFCVSASIWPTVLTPLAVRQFSTYLRCLAIGGRRTLTHHVRPDRPPASPHLRTPG